MKTESYINALGFYVLEPRASICIATLSRGPAYNGASLCKIYCERLESKAIISRSILVIRNRRTASSVVAWLGRHRVLKPVEPRLSSFPVAADYARCKALYVAVAALKDS